MANVCPFCVRDSGEVGRVTLENEHCVFLERMDLDQALKGSGIIIPRAHRSTVFDLTADEWMATYDLLAQVHGKMNRELNPDGFNVGWNCGEAGGQSIHHAHLHVIPRFDDEPFAGKGIRHWLKSEANIRPSLRSAP